MTNREMDFKARDAWRVVSPLIDAWHDAGQAHGAGSPQSVAAKAVYVAARRNARAAGTRALNFKG